MIPFCMECGGKHEPSGARFDCINHWKRRAIVAENQVAVHKLYGGELALELRQWLDQQRITSDNIGDIRGRLFMPWASTWNGLVRDETAARENKPTTCRECNGKGSVDSGGFTPWGASIELPCPVCCAKQAKQMNCLHDFIKAEDGAIFCRICGLNVLP